MGKSLVIKVLDKRNNLSKFSLLAILMFIFLIPLSTLTAQVIIKEKVEINPQSIIVPDAPAQGHTIRVDLEWTPANVPGSIIFYDLACTTPNSSWSDVSSTGSLSFSHTNIGYLGYPIQFRFYPCTLFPYPQEHSIQGTYKIYYDGRLMQTSPLQINGICGSVLDNAIYNASYNPPLITDYTFDIVHENYCFGNEGDIFISGNANSCYNSVEIDTSINKTLKLEILNGKEFISFYQNGVAKDTATVRYDNIDIWNLTIKDIIIKQDSFYTGSAPFEVITKSDWAGEIKYDTISINPQTPTQIYVSDEQPRKVYTGFSSIQVKTFSNYSSDSCWTEMPDSVKYRAVIIKGQNLGNLIDYSTGNGGDMLINLDHNNGQIVIGFETEGENVSEQDTVLVSISTTDPNINTLQAMLIVMPGDINVQIIPGTISQGDTAEVILKKRTINGLVDFAGNKLFNVEITKGSEYGWILDSQTNTQNTTFTNILQGFKIIATDSTGIDSTKIRIKVITEESVPAARLSRDNTKTNVTERAQTENNDDETILPDWIVPGGPIMIEGFGDVVVEDDCKNAPECVDIPEVPEIKFEKITNNTLCKTKSKRLGAFVAKIGEKFPKVELDVCYNQEKDQWQFKIKPNNKIIINYSLEICDEKIIQRFGDKILYSIEDLNNISSDSISICEAFSDILWHQTYGHPTQGSYFIYDIVEEHENLHRNDFFQIVDSVYFEDFYDEILDFHPNCSEIKNKKNVEIKGKLKYDTLIEKFRKKIKKRWDSFTGKKGSKRREDYEQKNQDKLWSIVIEDYYIGLQNLHPDKPPCIYCNVGCIE